MRTNSAKTSAAKTNAAGTDIGSADDLELRAIAALRAVLKQVSVVRLIDIRREPQGSGKETLLLAQVDVLGRSHTLACEVKSNARPENLGASLETPGNSETRTRVIIAPSLSPEARALCKQNHTGFLDLEGNARIALGEVFIGRRCLSHSLAEPAAQSVTEDKDVFMPVPHSIPPVQASTDPGVAGVGWM